MSDSETEHSSSTSECLRESEPSTSKGKQRIRKMKMISSSSEGEEEEEEEQQQATSSCVSNAEMSEEEEGEGGAGSIHDRAADDNLALSEGDDDGDSVDTDSSSEVPGAETCAICLGCMRGEVGSPESCEHTFCLICILEWAKTNASCPQDRKAFSKVLVRMTLGSEEVEREVVIKKQESEVVLIPETDNPTYCEVCHECDREERLLLCDGCDLGYHLECLDPPLEQVPVEEWFCPGCGNADIPSTVGAQATPQGESSTSRGRPRRQPSSSQRPRLIPRTRATERVRDRIIRKRREKRKKRRLSRKRKIESGEIDDARSAVDFKERLRFFGSIDSEIAATDMDDTFADQLLAGESGWASSRNPIVRKTDVAKFLRDAAFTPSTSYAGRASSAVINRINIQSEETREDDVLSSILENQSIVLTNSKMLSLTSDRKLKKEGEASDAESFSLKHEGSSIMSDPLPSRRRTQKDGDGRSTSQEDDQRHSSPPRGTPHSRFSHHSFYSQNSNYGHSSRGFEPNHRTQREERTYREERIQREERLSGTVHQSPLEDRRRSPPRMSYQRHMPSHQFRNQRNAPSEYRNRDPHTRWDERQRLQRSPPWKDSGHRQNQSSDSRWGRRHTESSGSSSREPSSQERYGRNGKDNSRENSDSRSFRSSSDRRGSSPASSVHDKYSRRNEDGDKYSRREEDRHRREDRGYHRHHHQRDHSHHRGYKSSYQTEKESPSSHSSQWSRSYSRSPVRSKSPIRSRSPARSRSRSRLREIHSRGQDDSRRRRKAHSNNDGEGAHKVSMSPLQPEGTLNDSQQQGNLRITSGNDSGSDAKLSPHFSQLREPSGEPSSETSGGAAEKDKLMEAKSRTLKNEMHEDKCPLPEGSPKVPRGVKREREDFTDVNDMYCNSDIVNQRFVPEEINKRKAETWIDKEEEGNELGVETADNLLNDAKSINFRVQSSCKGDQKRDKLHKDMKSADSRKNGSERDTQSPQNMDCAEDTNNEQQQSEMESMIKAEDQSERKKRTKFLTGFFGRMLEYTPEVELSHWDENSPEDVFSPFKVIKKADTSESDTGILLPFSLQKLIPGDKDIVKETGDRKKTVKEGKVKHKTDSDNRHEEGRNSEIQKTKGHEAPKSEKIDTDNIIKKEEEEEEENISEDKPCKKKTGHKAPKVDTKPHNNKPKNSVSPSFSHATNSSSKTRERSTEKPTIKDSQPQASQGKESLSHSNIKQERTQITSQICSLTPKKTKEHSHKKEPTEKLKGFQNIFGDISDISDTDSDGEQRSKKLIDSDGDQRSKKLIKGSPVVGKSPEKQKDTQETKHKPMHDKGKDTVRKSEHEKKVLKCDESPAKIPKLEGAMASGMTFYSQKEDTKSKSQGRGTKNAKPNKGHVLDLFGNTSDSDDAENVKVKAEESSVQKSPEKLLKSSPFKGDSIHRKGREHTESHKGKERKSEKETSPRRKSSEEAPKSTSSDSPKADSVHKKGKEATDSHKRKDKKLEKETSPHRKSSEEAPKSISSESLKVGSVHRKAREATDSHKGKDKKSEKEEKEASPHRLSEEPPKSTSSESPEGDSVHKKGKETIDSHKRKDKKSEKETSPHRSSEEPPKSTSSESPKGDSVHKKGKETTDKHKGKDRKSEKETSPRTHRKSSEEPPKSTSSESPKGDSVHRKGKETIDTHKRKDRKSEKETSPPHRRSSEEPPKIDSDVGKTREATNDHEEQKNRCPQETQKKVSEKPVKAEPPKTDSDLDQIKEATNNQEGQKDRCSLEMQKKISEKPVKAASSDHHDNYTDHRKAREATDIPRSQPQKDKRFAQAPTEDHGRSKAGCPSDGEGDTHSSKNRKSTTEEKKLREKDSVNRTENKQSVAAASSLQSTSHTSDRREKKDTGDTYAKQLKASLELKVVTEVKKWLDPHYRDKNITKEEYKEIVAKCVSKVVSAECGDVIESEKMRSLVEGYVKLYRHRRAKQQPPPSS